MAPPTLYLHTPTPAATRMSPCPVWAMLDLGKRRLKVGGASYGWTNSALPTGAANHSFAVSASEDDGHQRDDGGLYTRTSIANRARSNVGSFWRFTGATIADSKYIVKAEFRAKPYIIDNSSAVYTVVGDDQLASPSLPATTGANDIISRTYTTASLTFSPGDTLEQTTALFNPSTVLQEIYDLGERSVFSLRIKGGGTDDLELYSYDYNSASDAAELDVWTDDAPITTYEYRLDTPLIDLTYTNNTPSNITVEMGPDSPTDTDAALTLGTVGSLAPGEYGISGGYLYVRLSDNSDPSALGTTDITVSFDVSDTGDANGFERSTITWELEYDDVNDFNAWPDRFRYVNDPRPDMNGRKIDLSGRDSGQKPLGPVYALILTEGTYRFKVTVTNSSGESASITSGDIVIAPDSRTEYTVGGEVGDDYATTKEAFDALYNTNNVKLTVADDYTVDLDETGPGTSVAGTNWLIQRSRTGTNKPVLDYGGTGSGLTYFPIADTAENIVIDGFTLTNSTGDVTTYDFIAHSSCSFMAVSDLSVGGGNGTQIVDTFHGVLSLENRCFLALNCSCGGTWGACSYISGGITSEIYAILFIGGYYGPSRDENVLRFTTEERYINVLACEVYEDTSTGGSLKSPIRWRCSLGHAAYCYIREGGSSQHYIGRVNPAQGPGAQLIRYDSNYMVNNIVTFNHEASECAVVNNKFKKDSDDTSVLRFFSLQTSDGQSDTILFAHNTSLGHPNFGLVLDSDAGNRISGVRWAANVFKLDDVSNLYTIEDGTTEIYNNHFDSTGGLDYGDIRINNVLDRTHTDVNDLNSETWASGNIESPIVFGRHDIPSSPKTVITEPGVRYDYYGKLRNENSYAGAVSVHPYIVLITNDV